MLRSALLNGQTAVFARAFHGARPLVHIPPSATSAVVITIIATIAIAVTAALEYFGDVYTVHMAQALLRPNGGRRGLL
jgi:hypothetical protein